MENTTKSSFFEKGELEPVLSRDERFFELKTKRREIILDILSGKNVEKYFDLKSLERDIVMDTRGY